MPISNTKQKMYRPVLSATAISHIVALAKRDQPISTESISLIAKLSPFLAKIENEGITAAYTTTPPLSLEEKLGLKVDTPTPNFSGYEAKEEYWSACYDKYLADSASCSLQEIQAAREHMYLEGLMSPEEAREFELGTNPEDK